MADNGSEEHGMQDELEQGEPEQIERRIEEREVELEDQDRELADIDLERRDKLVKEALGKFGFFMHMTGYLMGCAYLILLGVIVRKTLPWVLIPIAIWTGFLLYHAWRAWHPKSKPEETLESLDKIYREHERQVSHDLDASIKARAEMIMKTRDYQKGLELLSISDNDEPDEAESPNGDTTEPPYEKPPEAKPERPASTT
ncbi:MAG TPA: 2TM domain-containing protein [Candidatus Anoxymicrobiaceae bacterium]|jgi:2TM domain